jgi:hypothetical protein
MTRRRAVNHGHRPLSDEEFTELITSAFDSVYARPVDLDASFADLQRRIAALPPASPAAARLAGRNSPRRSLPSRRMATALTGLAAAVAVSLTTVSLTTVHLMATGSGRVATGARSASSQSTLARGGGDALATGKAPHQAQGTRRSAFYLTDLHPETAATVRDPRAGNATLDGRPVVAWTVTMSGKPDRSPMETITYRLGTSGPARFSATLPSSGSGLTDLCTWKVQFTNGRSVTYHTSSTSSVPVNLPETASTALTIKVRPTRPEAGPASCTMADPVIHLTHAVRSNLSARKSPVVAGSTSSSAMTAHPATGASPIAGASPASNADARPGGDIRPPARRVPPSPAPTSSSPSSPTAVTTDTSTAAPGSP